MVETARHTAGSESNSSSLVGIQAELGRLKGLLDAGSSRYDISLELGRLQGMLAPSEAIAPAAARSCDSLTRFATPTQTQGAASVAACQRHRCRACVVGGKGATCKCAGLAHEHELAREVLASRERQRVLLSGEEASRQTAASTSQASRDCDVFVCLPGSSRQAVARGVQPHTASPSPSLFCTEEEQEGSPQHTLAQSWWQGQSASPTIAAVSHRRPHQSAKAPISSATSPPRSESAARQWAEMGGRESSLAWLPRDCGASVDLEERLDVLRRQMQAVEAQGESLYRTALAVEDECRRLEEGGHVPASPWLQRLSRTAQRVGRGTREECSLDCRGPTRRPLEYSVVSSGRGEVCRLPQQHCTGESASTPVHGDQFSQAVWEDGGGSTRCLQPL